MGRIAPTPVTWLLLGSISLAFTVQLAVGFDDPYAMIRLGANLSVLVFDGQWDRLVTASWLHAGWLHFGVNAVGLYFMGTAVERLLGSSRFALIYLGSCLGGTVASALASPGAPSVGASTGIVGLFAAIGYILVRFRKTLPPQVRRAIRSWILMLALNVALWVAFSGLNIDHAGHAGGFVVGVLSTVVLTIRWPPFLRRRRAEGLTRPIAWAMAGLFALGITVSAARFVRGDDARSARAMLTSSDHDPLALNQLAWFAVIDPKSDPALLQVALEMARRAVDELPADTPSHDQQLHAHMDTLATAHYRLGHYDDAVRIEREVYSAEPDATYGSQLARFLHARVRASGPILPPGRAPTLRLVRRGDMDIVPTLSGDAPEGLVFYAPVTIGERVVGLVTGELGPGRALPRRFTSRERWATAATLEVALLDTSPGLDPDTGFVHVALRMTDEVATYP